MVWWLSDRLASFYLRQGHYQSNPWLALSIGSSWGGQLSLFLVWLVWLWSSWQVWTHRCQKRSLLWWVLLWSGGWANLWQRWQTGAVIDYWSSPWFWFNLPDALISMAVIGLLVDHWFEVK